MMKETPWRIYWEDGWRWRIRVKYGIDYEFARRHNQAPYFSMTGETQLQARGNNRWMDSSAGAIHEAIEAHYRSLAPYLKWHLVSTDGVTHYIANAKYLFELAQGTSEWKADTNPVEAFKHTIKLGAFPGDEAPPELQADLERAAAWHRPGALKWEGPKEWTPGVTPKRFFKGVPWEYVQAWLEERLPKLQAAWVVDMGELGVLEE